MRKEDAIPGKTILFKGDPDKLSDQDMVGKTYVVSPKEMQDQGRYINVLGAPHPNHNKGYWIIPEYCELFTSEMFPII